MSSEGPYDIGDEVIIEAVFRKAGNLTDTTTSLVITTPEGDDLSPVMDHDSLGTYSYTFTVAIRGRWEYTVTGAGAVIASETNAFAVRS